MMTTPTLEERIQREVLCLSPTDSVGQRFSLDDRAAMELALDVSRRTGWSCEISSSGGLWSATWIENRRRAPGDARRRKIGALVTATAPTRALAICRSMLKAARMPRWPLGFAGTDGSSPEPRSRPETLAS